MDSLPDRLMVHDVELRIWSVDDVPALVEAVAASLDHLGPWMRWATPEEATDAALRSFVLSATDPAERGRQAVYGVFDASGRVLGGASLARRPEPGALEIGYWLRPEATGRGLMTAIAGTLRDRGMGLEGAERIEIRCDEANEPSAAVARRCGFGLARIEDAAIEAPGETGRKAVWVWPAPPT